MDNQIDSLESRLDNLETRRNDERTRNLQIFDLFQVRCTEGRYDGQKQNIDPL